MVRLSSENRAVLPFVWDGLRDELNLPNLIDFILFEWLSKTSNDPSASTLAHSTPATIQIPLRTHAPFPSINPPHSHSTTPITPRISSPFSNLATFTRAS